MKLTRVKVCGITREEDVEFLSACHVDAMGLIFHPGSLRRVSIPRATSLRLCAPPTMLVFGVFSHHSIGDILSIAEKVRLDVLQVQGRISIRDVRRLQREGYRVAAVFNPVNDDSWRNSEADIIVFDNSLLEKAGGTGTPFDWSVVRKPFPPHLMLAGGLNQSNITKSIEYFHPSLVDLNSGVESEPGKKSAKKLAAVLEEIANIT